jgi:hypothetical protein
MNTFWIIINLIAAYWLYISASDDLFKENRAAWFFFVFFSAWNGASAAKLMTVA